MPWLPWCRWRLQETVPAHPGSVISRECPGESPDPAVAAHQTECANIVRDPRKRKCPGGGADAGRNGSGVEAIDCRNTSREYLHRHRHSLPRSGVKSLCPRGVGGPARIISQTDFPIQIVNPTSTINAARQQIGVGGFRTSARAKELVMQVLDSNRITSGPMMSRFETEISGLHGCRFGLMSNSGTSALQIALAALKETHGWADGDEVIVPALTFVATANVVLYNSMVPVFVDVEADHYTLDPAQLERRITPRTRAIMPVHIGGMPCDMDPILAVAARHGLRIIEDSAETMFAKYRGRPVGSFGDVGCFSTYAAHIITTGVGGLCTTDDAELLVMMKSIMNHGRDSIYIRIDDDAGMSGADLFQVADRRFSFVRLGHSFRATEMEAALGVAQLEEKDEHWARRQRTATRYLSALSSLDGRLQLPTMRSDTDHAFMFFPLVVTDPSLSRASAIQFLEERGVETRYLLPLINQPVYRAMFGNLDAEYPVAARLNDTAFYVGCHPEMSDDDADYVIECLQTFFSEHR